jgi:transposase
VVVDASTTARLAVCEVAADGAGYGEVLGWADTHTVAGQRAWAIEGTGSYGRGLGRALEAAGEWVIEVDRPERRRGEAKSDPLDAERAARLVLGREHLAAPRSGGEREALRVLLAAREGAVNATTAAINQLKALVLTAPEGLRARLRDLSNTELVARCGRLRDRPTADVETAATIEALRGIAKRILDLDAEAASHYTRLDELTRELAPDLRAEIGIGPISAAQAIISWSHPGRCRSEAAFSSLAGAAPIEANSGQKQTRHRLNRGGDRQLNRALHVIVMTRLRCDPDTRAYRDRRRAEGKTDREIRRCLKRYVARRIYRTLEATAKTTP